MSKCTRLPVEGKRITWWDIWNIMGIVTVWQRSRLGLQLFCCLGWSFPNVINESKTSHPRIVLLAEIAQKRSSSQWRCLYGQEAEETTNSGGRQLASVFLRPQGLQMHLVCTLLSICWFGYNKKAKYCFWMPTLQLIHVHCPKFRLTV